MDVSPLTALFGLAPTVLLVFARIVALFVSGPVVGAAYVPPSAKALLALAITLVLAPLQAHAAPPPPTSLWFIVLLAKEALVGLTLGFLLSLFVEGVRFAGDLANRHAGFSAAESFDPETEATISPVGDLFHIAVVMLFLAGDGHHHLLAALSRSFEVVPLGAFAIGPGLAGALTAGVHQLCVIAMTLSFPVLTAVMAITVAEGVIVRAIPQINILNFSFAVKIGVSLLVLYAGLPAVVAFLATVLAAMERAGVAILPLMR